MKRVLLCAVMAVIALSCKKESDDKPFVYEAIDLGLSVKWAACNLGAIKPEEFGDYFAWGETEPKYYYSWITYKWCNDNKNNFTKYCTSKSHWGGSGSPDGKTVLDLEDDAAHFKLGGKWRIPTAGEIDELIATTNNASYQWEWKSLNGHSGWLVTYLVNNNTMFLPIAGYRSEAELYSNRIFGLYWSSSLIDDGDLAWVFCFSPFSVLRTGGAYYSRDLGLSIRPVTE